MAWKQTKISARMLFVWFLLAGLIFLFAPQQLTCKFQSAFTHIFRLPLSIGRNISLASDIQQPLTDIVSRREYNKLQNHIANLTQLLEQEHKKNEQLSGLRNRFVLEGASFVLADIITASSGGLESELSINRGQIDKIKSGQFVLADNSVIGVVSNVSSRTAQVRLITDYNSKIPVQIAGISRIMQGCGNNSAMINLLMTTLEVKKGDAVYIDKQPGIIDAPMIVGSISKCKKDSQNPLLWDVTVEPVCQIDKLTSVAILVMNPQKD